ncbi:MAG TPA: ABC transporter ATP-binding protein [Candidatus Paceibacterota bacterium]
MPKKKRDSNYRAVFKIFWKHTKQHPWLFSTSILGVFAVQFSNIVGPIFIKDIFNLITQTSINVGPQILHLLMLYALLSFIGWAGGRLEMWLGYTMISKVEKALTTEAFQNLMSHSYQYFTSAFSGTLTRRISRFSGAYENLYYSLVTTVLEGIVYLVGITGVLWYRSSLLGFILFFWVILFVYLQWKMSHWRQSLRLARAEEDSNLTAALADAISNQNTVTLFSGSRYEDTRVASAAHKYQVVQLRAWNSNSLIYGIQGLLSLGLNVGMLWLGITLVRDGRLTIGDLVLIQTYLFGIFNTVWGLGRQFQLIQNSVADATEMVETMRTPIEVRDVPNAQILRIESGNIQFDHIYFGFTDGREVLDDFDLSIHGGKKIALVGPSGAGKSTITKLLLRLYDLKEGEIKIDNQNIAKVTQDSLRDAIAFVPQEPILFHRSLMENIRYGRRDATDEEVIEAAKKAHCHEFIEQLPEKYGTFVGERGIKLSGGERQRVAIARAILKNAPILVLDEATSSLDSQSEAYIQEALEVLMRGKTVIVIAHRLSTIMKMDRIVVLEGGKVIASGTHEELLQKGGLYHKLWSIQAGGFIIEDEPLAEE